MPQSDPLQSAATQFAAWRRRRKRGTRIPDDLWSTAVSAASTHSVSKVAQTLKLDYYALRDRIESRKGEGFVEIALPPSICTLELQGADGTRLRLELPAASPEELVRLTAALWAATR